ncbi:phosphatase PAP2 family protein [Actinocorallia sp. B10E7]|uniref:phosphatase PAP2 family protein n=1 Tax=Actinocorallia sp. B10E7 TaxID=3153558 RepID=UPI00325F023C
MFFGRFPPAARELVLLTVLYTAYRLGRLVSAGRVGEARENARELWRLERALGLPGEDALQRLVLDHDLIVRAANAYYATVHFPAIIVFLLWMYLRRPVHYLWIRRVLTVLTAAGLLLHVTVPLAPPRLVEDFGMTDTGVLHGQSPYGGSAVDAFSNQYAAMPSLHVGWALLIAIGLIAATRARLRLLWLLHPLATLLVVVVTAHHYWLDALVAVLLLALALVLLRPPRPVHPSAGTGDG